MEWLKYLPQIANTPAAPLLFVCVLLYLMYTKQNAKSSPTTRGGFDDGHKLHLRTDVVDPIRADIKGLHDDLTALKNLLE
mgnify:CR=1 FL=1